MVHLVCSFGCCSLLQHLDEWMDRLERVDERSMRRCSSVAHDEEVEGKKQREEEEEEFVLSCVPRWVTHFSPVSLSLSLVLPMNFSYRESSECSSNVEMRRGTTNSTN